MPESDQTDALPDGVVEAEPSAAASTPNPTQLHGEQHQRIQEELGEVAHGSKALARLLLLQATKEQPPSLSSSTWKGSAVAAASSQLHLAREAVLPRSQWLPVVVEAIVEGSRDTLTGVGRRSRTPWGQKGACRREGGVLATAAPAQSAYDHAT